MQLNATELAMNTNLWRCRPGHFRSQDQHRQDHCPHRHLLILQHLQRSSKCSSYYMNIQKKGYYWRLQICLKVTMWQNLPATVIVKLRRDSLVPRSIHTYTPESSKVTSAISMTAALIWIRALCCTCTPPLNHWTVPGWFVSQRSFSTSPSSRSRCSDVSSVGSSETSRTKHEKESY